MKPKIILDIIMTAIFLALMKTNFTGLAGHEILGLGILLLFIVHQALNFRWIAGVSKGFAKHTATPKAKFMFILDAALLISMIFTVVSGGLISKVLFPQIAQTIDGSWSAWHHFAAYISLVLMSVHIGLHWQGLMKFFKKLLGFKGQKSYRTAIARVTLALMAFCGVRAALSPEIYQNFTSPFVATNYGGGQNLNLYKEEEDSSNNLTATLMANGQEVADIPSLEDFLSKMVCTGCDKRCPLTALQCNKGSQYQNTAIQEYNTTYNQSETVTPAVTQPSNSNGHQGRAKRARNGESKGFQSSANQANNAATPLDYICLMTLIIGGTHYIVTIQKNRRQKSLLSK